MKLKKLLALGLTTVMTAGLLVGCGSSSDDSAKGSEDKVYKIGMITDTGGVNDESFNQSAWKGLEDLKAEYGDKVEVKYLESTQDADYAPNIETFADQDYDLIVGVGYKLEDAIKKAASDYPEKQFAIIDSVVEAENVNSLTFDDSVSSFLTGLIAGKMTETGKVAFIGGIESDLLRTFEYGFKAGVKTAKEDATIASQYANSFSDAAKGKSIANQMHKDGVDIIFTAAGATGTGAIEAAKENNKKAIGVDSDQYNLAPNNMLTSAMKNIDVAMFNLCKEMVEGNYKGGQVIVNTLENGGVGIAPTSDKNVDPEVLTYVNEMAEKIKSGEVKVPSNKEEFEAQFGK
ncbi:BMP family ABC transporter substrate-binding protein [Romboutsia ilealis]|uniref:BMP family ABC transporter substrate-binding protein n=1 Tax=Romboutsia faecis TaxID=2764597 RepID=A0ABR7JRD6_9FIRM|nr:BMP family ABC transporter substrate-binding protein [Romboutsia faecis]MBC5997445.1 BMP family ABC transporter substrate-binding protein [Romboutsia faecis]MRN24922.1 BMP family ABC transporter substrate-binding protein [Romboutsia ilealis]